MVLITVFSETKICNQSMQVFLWFLWQLCIRLVALFSLCLVRVYAHIISLFVSAPPLLFITCGLSILAAFVLLCLTLIFDQYAYDSGVKKTRGSKNRGSKKHGFRFFNGQIHRQFFGIFTKIVNFSFFVLYIIL